MTTSNLRIAFVHPDLGIGGAERLVVDAALGLESLGHSVDIYTSHHDPAHCFEETRDGSLKVHHIKSPFPRSIGGKLHIVLAHLRQAHLSFRLLSQAAQYDVFFVDQLATCIPFLWLIAGKRVVFYCHFPDKLLAGGEFVDGQLQPRRGWLMGFYRRPMDWLEEFTTSYADIILANSLFTARVFKTYFKTIDKEPRVVYPGINIAAYKTHSGKQDESIISERPTFVSINRFEQKKNVALAIESFAVVRKNFKIQPLRLVLAGGYDPRLQDNMNTLSTLLALSTSLSLSYYIISPTHVASDTCKSPQDADILFILNFTTQQRSALLNSKSTLALLYTPKNEHFGIGPVEGMICGLPVLACNSGGPMETIIDMTSNATEGTGWLREPEVREWAEALELIIRMKPKERAALSQRTINRAKENFSFDTMAKNLEVGLKEAVALGPVDWMEVIEVEVLFFFIIVLVLGLAWWLEVFDGPMLIAAGGAAMLRLLFT